MSSQGRKRKINNISSSSNKSNDFLSRIKRRFQKENKLKNKLINDILQTPEFKDLKQEDLSKKSKIYLYSIYKSEEDIND